MSITTVSPASASPSQALGLQDFLKILLTQLQFQDPLKPMDNQQFMAQMAQFTTLQQTQQLNQTMSLLVANQAALQSIGLIGRTVEYTSQDGLPLIGQVTGLLLEGATPQVVVSASGTTVTLALSQLAAVR